MIFSAEMVKAIKEGRKTVTRRLANGKPDCRYREGYLYAVQAGHGMPAEDEITVLTVSGPVPLGHLSSHDAKREGFSTPTEFMEHWRALHGSYDPQAEVFVIAFRLGDFRDIPRLLSRRIGTRHGDYVDVSYLALREPLAEALTAEELEVYVRQARARDAERRPPRTERDRQREKRRRKRSVLTTPILVRESAAVSVSAPSRPARTIRASA